MSNLFLAMLAAVCAVFFAGAAFAHHRPNGLFGYSHERIAFVGNAFGLVLPLVAMATFVGISNLVLAIMFGLAALMMAASVFAPKLGKTPQASANLLAYYAQCVGTAAILCGVIFHLSHGPLYVAAAAALAFTASCAALIKIGLTSSLSVRATSA